MVEVISSPQPGASPTLLQEWSVQTAKRANRGYFMFNSELTVLNGTTQLQTEGYVCGLNESDVNSQQWCDAMPAESQYSAGKCYLKTLNSFGMPTRSQPFQAGLQLSGVPHSSCRHLEQASKEISRKHPRNQFPSSDKTWRIMGLQLLATSWRLAQASSLSDRFLHLQSLKDSNS